VRNLELVGFAVRVERKLINKIFKGVAAPHGRFGIDRRFFISAP